MISASALERIHNCPASEALPHVKRQSKAASFGSVIHKFLEDCTNIGAAKALDRVPPEHQEACSIISLENLPAGKPGSYAAEVTLAFDTEGFTAREVGRGLQRDYSSLKPTEIPGTADVIGLADDSVVVVDYKTGYSYQHADSWQMRFLGMAAAFAYDKENAHLLTIIVHDDETVSIPHFMSLTDFAKTATEVRAAFIRVAAAKTAEHPYAHEFSVGNWCKFCPALRNCPAQVKMIRDLSRRHDASPKASAKEIAAALTPVECRETWVKLKAAKTMIDTLDEACRLFASNERVPLGDGKFLGVKERETESLDGGVVLRVLQEKHGKEVADSVVELKATKSKLESSLRTLAASGGGKLSQLKAEVLDAVRAAGGARVRKTSSVVEYYDRGADG